MVLFVDVFEAQDLSRKLWVVLLQLALGPQFLVKKNIVRECESTVSTIECLLILTCLQSCLTSWLIIIKTCSRVKLPG
jgi:hypothetical protein